MKQIISVALLGICFAHSPAQAQTVDDVINKYVEAMGGKEKLSQVKSIYIESTTTAMGNDGPSTTTILNGKGFKSEAEFNGAKIIQCFTENGGWAVNPMAGSGAAEAMPEEQYKQGREQMFVGGPLFNYGSKGSTVTLDGKDGNDYKLTLTNKDKISATYYIDGNSFYLNKIVRKTNINGQEIEVIILPSNYKKTDYGILVPYSTEIKLGEQFSMTSNVNKVEVNKPVDPSIFNMPK